MFLDAIANNIMLSSFSNCVLLVYRNMIDFYVLTFFPYYTRNLLINDMRDFGHEKSRFGVQLTRYTW